MRQLGGIAGYLKEPISTYPDIVSEQSLGLTAYYKPALGLVLLREVILGPERFDYAFREYIRQWAFKHPTPEDFFRAMESGSGESLSWFWKTWFYGLGGIDQAVEGFEYKEANDPAQGAFITISNKGEVPMPAVVEVIEEGGNKTRINLPVEIWQRGNTWKFFVKTTKKIQSVELDPDQQLPDYNPANNKK
jgi:aminopeptidase N